MDSVLAVRGVDNIVKETFPPTQGRADACSYEALPQPTYMTHFSSGLSPYPKKGHPIGKRPSTIL